MKDPGLHIPRPCAFALALALVGAVCLAISPPGFAHGEGIDKSPRRTAADYRNAPETAFGRASAPARATRTLRIEMSDAMRYDPAEITVKRGERVRFVVSNRGRAMHEMVLGTLDELRAHGELMQRFPGMEHDELHMVHVAPGESMVMGWHFSRTGEFFFGCLLPGHFDAGMVGRIIVR
jgi:uncharacterized cupredoxin-like copper-binding protein